MLPELSEWTAGGRGLPICRLYQVRCIQRFAPPLPALLCGRFDLGDVLGRPRALQSPGGGSA